jgi:nucleoside phosphorylase
MLADSRDTHESVIHAALTALGERTSEDALNALRTIREFVPDDADLRFIEILDQREEQLARLRTQEVELQRLHEKPQLWLQAMRDRSVPYFSRSKEAEIMPTPPIKADVAIVTAVETESRAFLQALDAAGLEKQSVKHEDRWYWRFSLSRENGAALDCVQIRATDKGPQSTQSLVHDIIHDLQPRLILMIGVCGGFKERGVGLYDAILARRVFNYERARVMAGGAEYQPQPYEFNAEFIRLVQHLQDGNALETALGSSRLHVKDYAAGEKVLMDDDADLRKRILALSGDIYAIEMEGHGLMHALWEAASRRNVAAGLIKCISDLGDANMRVDKETKQTHAALTAANIALAVLAHY